MQHLREKKARGLVRTGLVLLAFLLAAPVPAAAVDLDFKEADIRDVLRVLGDVGGFNVVTDPAVRGSVTFYLQGMDPRQAVDLVVKSSGYGYTFVGNTLVVAPRERLADQFQEVRTAFIPLRHIDPEAVVPALEMVVQPAVVRADPVGRGVLIRGDAAQIRAAEAFLKERDVPPPLELDFVDADVRTVLSALARAGGYNLIAVPETQAKLTLFLRGASVREALDLVARQAGFRYRIDGNTIVIVDERDMPAAKAAPDAGTGPAVAVPAPPVVTKEVRIIPLRYITTQQARALAAMLLPPEDIWADEAAGTLVVRGSGARLDEVERLLAGYDLPRLRVDGIVVKEDDRLAVLSLDRRSHVVREGTTLDGITVEQILGDRVVLRTATGRLLELAIGGGE